MKKLLILPLLLSTLTLASDYKYELSPMIGYNIAEGNLGMKDDGYFAGGVELQFNYEDSKISPEFSIYYSPQVDYSVSGKTDVLRGAFNGVYTFEKYNSITPFAKAGLGIESLSTNRYANEDALFVDMGAGAKVPFTENLALKFEAIYMAKISSSHAGNADSNLLTLVGLTYSFGAKVEAPLKVEEEIQAVVIIKETPVEEEEVVVAVVILDDDKDGIENSNDKCLQTPLGVKVDAEGCAIPQDSDNDGVVDSLDKCPSTEAGVEVDANGCAIDLDKDGVLNENDICPNTPLGEAVNSDGCPKSIDLHINFENNSYKVKAESMANIDAYAEFLKKYTNYSAKIVGYTDSRGSASYNQKLSQKRADEVARLLIQKGVDASRVEAIGRGEANPVADNATAEGRAKNRRIEAELTRD